MLTIGLYGIPDRDGNHAAHDHAVAIMRNGTVLASMELERFTGRKHDNRLAQHFDTLVQPWLEPRDQITFVQANSFLGGTFETASGSLRLCSPSGMRPEHQIQRSALHLAGPFAEITGESYTVCHELAHIGTCLPFFGNFKENSLLIHVDGGASRSSSSAWIYRTGKLELIEYSWNTLKRQTNLFNDNPLAAAILGLTLADHLSMPGKLMGFASVGTVRPEIMRWLSENNWFSDPSWRTQDMLGVVSNRFGSSKCKDPTHVPLHWDIAACMQQYFEESVVTYLQSLKKTTGAAYLYYSGGAALNIRANARIESELGFEAVHIPPAPSDCGLALGAAAFFEWISGNPVQTHTPYLTRLSTRDTAHGQSQAPSSVEGIANRIAAGQIVATCIRDAEVGPRALGHRSLLAKPDCVELRSKLSERMKKREWYRPVAPVMLEEVASEVLEAYKPSSTLGDFMLGAWRVKPAFRNSFAGCLHRDGTVRAQVIRPAQVEQRELRSLLLILKAKFNILGLINTSFNERGKPIVQTLSQAKCHAAAMGVDHLWNISQQ